MHITRDPHRPNIWFDVALALGLFTIAVLSTAGLTPGDSGVYTTEPDFWAYVVIAAMTLPLVLRRVYPVSVLWVVVGAFVVGRLIDYPLGDEIIALPMAMHAIGSEVARPRADRAAWTATLTLTAFTLLGIFEGSVVLADVVAVAALTALPYMLGREVHERRSYAKDLEHRAVELELRQEAQARDAVRNERRRIARELHDVVAHQMTVMTIQASAAKRMIDRDPAKATAALTAVETAGHEGLNEMRRLLGMLRPEDGAPPATAPQPGLGALDELCRHTRSAGLDVDVTVTGDPYDLPVGIDLGVYRIIQEALTNTLKHGGPNTRAQVMVDYAPDAVTIEVIDDGRGAAMAMSEPSRTGGQGLLGMQERVAILEGEFAAGPRRGGGFRVSGRIPVEGAGR